MARTEAVEVLSVDNIADEVVERNVPKKWQSYIWDSLDKSPEERRFLFKLDSALITFACLGLSKPRLLSISIGCPLTNDI